MIRKRGDSIIFHNNIGYGLRFNGSNQYVLSPFNQAFNFQPTDRFTLLIWVYSQNGNYSNAVTYMGTYPGRQNGYDGEGFLLRNWQSKFLFDFGFIGTNYIRVQSVQTLPEASLMCLAVTKGPGLDASTIKLFLQGKKIPCSILLNTLINSPLECRGMIFGYDSSNYNPFFNGVILSSSMYNVEFTEKQVEELSLTFGGVHTEYVSNLVGHYTFDKKSGILLPDLSPFATHASLINFDNPQPGPANAWVYGKTLTPIQ